MPITETEIVNSTYLPPETDNGVLARVRWFIQENFLYMMPDFVLGDDDRLLERGVVDSMGIAELISFVESEFGVVAAEDDISEANFGSLRSIANFVASRKAIGGGD
ncbi:MAG TPA: acyl carrier protein [Gemmatimonadaceae bacterium]|nr:acyl carrier protein [Gemmatimonadaceae bacterium]